MRASPCAVTTSRTRSRPLPSDNLIAAMLIEEEMPARRRTGSPVAADLEPAGFVAGIVKTRDPRRLVVLGPRPRLSIRHLIGRPGAIGDHQLHRPVALDDVDALDVDFTKSLPGRCLRANDEPGTGRRSNQPDGEHQADPCQNRMRSLLFIGPHFNSTT
jgi:hypothetical protein